MIMIHLFIFESSWEIKENGSILILIHSCGLIDALSTKGAVVRYPQPIV